MPESYHPNQYVLIPPVQLKSIKNKKVRGFYEEQNSRLDDWMEVDMVVSSLADDIVDSMNPQDPDHDGVAEDLGPLAGTGGNLEPFLPDDERERRRKSAKHVKWAINVGLHNVLSVSRLTTVRSTYSSTSFCSQQNV
jgi:hypothetical protein